MNAVVLTGRLGADAEASYTEGGTPLVRFRMGVNRNRGREGTDWFFVSFFGKGAERISEWLKKGRHVAVSGAMETWTRDDKTYFNVIADQVDFLDSKRDE